MRGSPSLTITRFSPAERHHVGDRPEGGQPERIVGAAGWHDAASLERLHEFESDTGSCQPVERIRRTGKLRVHERVGGRQLGRGVAGREREMVVRDDEAHVRGAAARSFDTARAAIHGDHASRSTLGELGERGRVEPVSLRHAVGNVWDDRRACGSEAARQHGAGGNAVRVVVPINRDGAAVVDGRPDCIHSRFHRRKPERIVVTATAVKKRGGACGIKTASGQDLPDDGVHPGQGFGVAQAPAARRRLHRRASGA